MDIVADENVDVQIVAALRLAGHSVVYVRELDPGIADTEVLALANKLGAPPLTSDKDFGELVFRRRLVHAGVILFRLAGLPGSHKAEIVVSVLKSHAAELPGAFTLVTPNQVRIRAEEPVGHSLSAKAGWGSALVGSHPASYSGCANGRWETPYHYPQLSVMLR